MTIITGIVYPLIVTILAQVIFPHKANGSLIRENGVIIGSELIGQRFDTSIYFWSRPSAVQYNPLPSGASNYGLTSKTLVSQVREREDRFHRENFNSPPLPGEGLGVGSVPPEMIFASGSGLDPHISPEAAFMQVDRICGVRNFDEKQRSRVVEMIKKLTEKPQFNIFGDQVVNVLLLNLELKKYDESRGK